jgi:hypothetical protein
VKLSENWVKTKNCFKPLKSFKTLQNTRLEMDDAYSNPHFYYGYLNLAAPGFFIPLNWKDCLKFRVTRTPYLSFVPTTSGLRGNLLPVEWRVYMADNLCSQNRDREEYCMARCYLLYIRWYHRGSTPKAD